MNLSAEVARVQDLVAEDSSPESGSARSAGIDAPALGLLIDHTLLKVDATPEQIDVLCREAREFGFRTVCVRLPFVSRAKEQLKGSTVGVCCVVGFHEGTNSTNEKLEEAKSALSAGAVELDAVLNRAHVRDRTDFEQLDKELRSLRALAKPPAKVKLILETSELDEKQVVAATVVAYHAGLDFVKTSTGFCGHGARTQHVALMRRVADVLEKENARHMCVKASGGIRTLRDALSMIDAGAERLGVSAGVAIVQGVGSSSGNDAADASTY